MWSKSLNIFLLIIAFMGVCLDSSVKAQGINTIYQQNRVNHKKTAWQIMEGEDANILYYKGGLKHAEFVLQQFHIQLKDIQTKIKYRISGGVNIVLYNNLSEYLNSNAEIINPEFNYAGQTKFENNKMVLYYPGSNYEFAKQVRKEIAKVITAEMIFGGSINEKIQNSALIILPDWYNEGFASYIGEEWNTNIDNWAREFFLTTNFKNIEDLSYSDRVKAGHSIWRYIEQTEGFKAIPEMLYHTRVSKNYESGIYYARGVGLNQFMQEWFNYYKSSYQMETTRMVSIFGTEKIPERLKKLPNTQFRISPDGENAAFVVNDNGKYSIYIYNLINGSSYLLLKGGHKIINKAINYNFPLINWNTTGEKLGVLLYERNSYIFMENKLSKGAKKVLKQKTYSLQDFTYVNDFCFSKEVDEYIIAGVLEGQSDLFIYKGNKLIKQLTNDLASEKYLRYQDELGLLYISEGFRSNQEMADLPINAIKLYDLEKPNELPKNLFSGAAGEIVKQPMLLKQNYISFLSDRSGIINSYALHLNGDSLEPKALSNYNRSILFQDINLNSKLGADMLFVNNEYHISSYDLAEDPIKEAEKIKAIKTLYTKHKIRLKRINKRAKIKSKSNGKDTIKYGYSIQTGFEKIDYQDSIYTDTIENLHKYTLTKYKPRFQVNYVTTQFDNSALGSYYYTGEVSPDQFNTGVFNLLAKANISDITNSYHIEAGVRLNSYINGATYFLNASAIQGRIDKSFSLFRRGYYVDYGFPYHYRNLTTGGAFTLAYPINENLRTEFSIFGRGDRLFQLTGVDINVAREETIDRQFLGYKARVVYDNTISKGFNNISGRRGVVFLENFGGLNHKSQILNLGIDLRNYQPLYRSIIFATRATANTSFGKDKVLYRLGGVENWIGPQFNENNQESKDLTDYKLQMLAGNLRGFSQSEQKGNSYFLINNELRIPIVRLFYNKNIRSDFLKNIMVVPFLDIGASWIGSTPWSLDNPNNVVNYKFDIYTIKVRAARNPILYSTGFGLRSKFLNYVLKYDMAWGYKDNVLDDKIHHFSLGIDF